MAAAPQLWNSLPVVIRSACTIRDFKQKLKTFLFSEAFVYICFLLVYICISLTVFLQITLLYPIVNRINSFCQMIFAFRVAFT